MLAAAEGELARVEGAHENWRFVWEARSVNGRGLEWRVRLPSGFDALDPEMRKIAKDKLSRGSLNIGLTLSSGAAASGYAINEAMLDDVVAMIEKVRARIDCGKPQAEGLLALRGVIEQTDETMSGYGATLWALRFTTSAAATVYLQNYYGNCEYGMLASLGGSCGGSHRGFYEGWKDG